MHVADHIGLAADELAALRGVVERLLTLEDVIRWGLALSPPRLITKVVVQDEYSHDVIVPWTRGRHLAFDTT